MILGSANVASFSQLAGQTVAASAEGSADQILFAAYAKAAHLGSVNYAVTGSPQNNIQYTIGGQTAATWAASASAVVAVKQDPKLHILVTAKQMAARVPDYGTIVAVSRPYAVAHPGVATEIAECTIQGSRWLAASEKNFAKEVNAVLPGQFPTSTLKPLWEQILPTYGVNGGLDRAAFSTVGEFWASVVNPSAANNSYFTDFLNIFSTKYIKAAVKQLGGLTSKRAPDASGIRGY